MVSVKFMKTPWCAQVIVALLFAMMDSVQIGNTKEFVHLIVSSTQDVVTDYAISMKIVLYALQIVAIHCVVMVFAPMQKIELHAPLIVFSPVLAVTESADLKKTLLIVQAIVTEALVKMAFVKTTNIKEYAADLIVFPQVVVTDFVN